MGFLPLLGEVACDRYAVGWPLLKATDSLSLLCVYPEVRAFLGHYFADRQGQIAMLDDCTHHVKQLESTTRSDYTNVKHAFAMAITRTP